MHQKHKNKTSRNADHSAQNLLSQPNSKAFPLLLSWKFGLPVALIVIVCAAVFVAYLPVLSAQAISLDDDLFLTGSKLVQNPSWDSAKRVLTEVLKPTAVAGYYQPLSILTVMADFAMGASADNMYPFHRTSLLLHIANTALIIVLIWLLFGRLWVAAGAGLLFGLHPMTVESVAWLADRKTLLASFFVLMSLVFYLRFVTTKSYKPFILSLLMYLLSLLSKPTAVPVPVVMLLMDFWPLKRLRWRTVLEKLPFFAAAAVIAVITIESQRRTSITMPHELGFGYILLHICHNIIFYPYKILWPAYPSAYHILPETLTLSEPVILAGLIGTCILVPLLILSLRWTRSVITGWLIFFVMIFPTTGVIGHTNVIASDKHAYLPSVGLIMLLAWFVIWLHNTCKISKQKICRVVLIITVFILAGAETFATRLCLSHWQDSEKLFRYMLRSTPDAPPINGALGNLYASRGEIDQAIKYLRRAVEAKPDFIRAHNNLGIMLVRKGQFQEAIKHYRTALQLKRNYTGARYNLAFALQKTGQLEEAVSRYRCVLDAEPNNIRAHYQIAIALQSQGKLNEAIEHYKKAVQLQPNFIVAHGRLGLALAERGEIDAAITQFRIVLAKRPDDVAMHCNLGALLLSRGETTEAVTEFRRALQIDPHYTKAATLLETALAKQKNH